MASLQTHRPDLLLFNGRPSVSLQDRHFRTFQVYFKSPYSLSLRFRSSPSSGICRVAGLRKKLFRCCSLVNGDNGAVQVKDEIERPPFDINLAVILAGFSFEAYTTPPDNIGRHEVDAAGCKTVYLSESFVREIYDGQLFLKLKKGYNLPAMDPWGTSDPYVVMELDGQIVKSKIKWGTKEPTWNEDFSFNIKLAPDKILQVAAWDANLVTPHKRMGNSGISLEVLCDGNTHEVEVELEGMGGGGNLQLEIRYKSFGDIDAEKKWWNIPFVSDFFRQNGFESALKAIVGSDTVPARKFVEYAFGQMKSFNNGTYLQNDKSLGSDKFVTEDKSPQDTERLLNVETCNENSGTDESLNNSREPVEGNDPGQEIQVGGEADKWFWKNFASVINQSVVGLPIPEKVKWDGLDLLSKVGLQSRNIAEAGYVESGLATPKFEEINANGDKDNDSGPLSSLPDVKKVTQDLLQQTESVLGAFMVLTATVSQLNKDGVFLGKETSTEKDDGFTNSKNENFPSSIATSNLDEDKAEEMKALFSTAESAMEAWAMLATSLGHPSFIKSEFEKICFLDNESTDTQVAIWRDTTRRRLVVAFRGTEQSKWKDLRTDLMLVPAGLNPERIGGDFKQEVQVHSGFLSAYDSVRIRILSLLKVAIGSRDDGAEPQPIWHVYVTGHSLGGALATLLALELSSSQLAKRGAISVTMYNFGSPRVGNRRFAELYNEKVKDSWRVVNHRDIIPSVPRLMGYCHVAQPVYLAAGDYQGALENVEGFGGEGYQGDVIGEATPDVIMTEFMKGEKELIEKILQTEINIYRSIRDGSALMQHMEDFYYISLLEKVRSNYQRDVARTLEEGSSTTDLTA